MNFAIFEQLFLFNLTNFKQKKTPESLQEFLYIKLKLVYELASAAIKFNAEPATNQPI